MLTEPLKQARKIAVAVVGGVVVVAGLAMIVTPGPGWVVIALGLSILSVEFDWARRILTNLRDLAGRVSAILFRSRSTGAPEA